MISGFGHDFFPIYAGPKKKKGKKKGKKKRKEEKKEDFFWKRERDYLQKVLHSQLKIFLKHTKIRPRL